MAGGTESAVDEGAEARVAEDLEDFAEHDGHVRGGGGSVCILVVEVGVEFGDRTSSFLEVLFERKVFYYFCVAFLGWVGAFGDGCGGG